MFNYPKSGAVCVKKKKVLYLYGEFHKPQRKNTGGSGVKRAGLEVEKGVS